MAIGVGRAALLAALLCAGASGCGGGDGSRPGGGLGGGALDGSAQTDSAAPAVLDFARFDQALLEAIASYNQTAPEGKQLRGASAVVIERERGIVHTSGYLEYDADRLYLIASASKILSAGVLMRLADEGLLDLDTPIYAYLPDWSESGAGEVTIAQLLSNSSGLASLAEVTGSIVTSGPYFVQACQYSHSFALNSCGRTIYGAEPPRAPDTTFAYGGSQWQLAGAIAEQVSNKSWAELVHETYVAPCGAESLGYTNPFLLAIDPTWYPGFFRGDVSALPATQNPSIEGGGYVTVADYGELLLMHLRGGTCGEQRVLSEAAVERMQRERVRATYDAQLVTSSLPGTWGYGLGWWVSEDEPLVVAPGAYGAVAFLDTARQYGAFIALEAGSNVGTTIALQVKPSLDAVFDAR